MRAGRLRHRLAVDAPVTAQDGAGDEIVTWTAYGTVSAEIEPLRGQEGLQAHQNLAELDTRITIRWSPEVDAITAKWRFRFNDTVYNISAPPAHRMLRQREVEFLCKSGVNLG